MEFKKLITIVLSVMIILGTLPYDTFSASAATTTYTEGYYTYTVSTNCEATITDCDTSISGEVTIPSTLGGYPVKSIGISAFYNCTSLTSVIIPDSVISIGDSAFDACTGLINVTIGDSVTSIGNEAFYFCTSLTNVIIGDSVTSIGIWTFYYCTSLETVTIGNSVTNIGYFVFAECKSLKSLVIGKNVMSINSYAFADCNSLVNISVCENNSNYCSENGILFNKNKSTIVIYPRGKNSTSYIIPDSVTNIGESAFNSTELTYIIIPNSVTSIGKSAFNGCSSLKNVYYIGSEDDFQNISIGLYNDCFINANWHYYTSVYIKPTCTEYGYTKYTCSNCDDTYTVTDTESGYAEHIYPDEWSIKFAPTCTTDGEEYKSCTECGNTITQAIPRLGHDYAEDFTIDKEATVFEDGSKSKHCSRCDSVIEITAIPKTSLADGVCGANAKWAVTQSGTLIISGSGTVKNYGTAAAVPWYSYSDKITTVEIGEGITAIGHYNFNSLINLKTVKCSNPDTDFNKISVFGISDMVFYGLGGGAVEHYTKTNSYEFIKPDNPQTPVIPTLVSSNAVSIVLLRIDGYEYSLDGINWQVSNVFENLLPDTEYIFYQRIADGVYKASAISDALRVSTTPNPSSSDLVVLRKELLEAEESTNLAYDYNNDGEINVRDLVRLKKYLASIAVTNNSNNIESQTVELLTEIACLEQKSAL